MHNATGKQEGQDGVDLGEIFVVLMKYFFENDVLFVSFVMG